MPRVELPTGTVTLLFSDMEGSTRLLAELGRQYGEVLSAQRHLLRTAFGDHDGTELGTEGDSFFVAFRSAAAAAMACLAAQRALGGHRWPGGHAPKVRMGMHTGEPTRHEDGYIGMDVHRAARIAGAAHGGQVILSESTRQLVSGRVPDVTMADLGWHRLKDIAEAEHLHQLMAPGLRTDFPPLRSLGNRGSLPVPPTALVGREAELAEITARLTGPERVRLLTLTGPGGVGKTRLALAACARLDESFADGVYFVPLAPVTDGAVMWTTIAEAIGVTGDGRSAPAFFDHIRGQEALLVLDNLEQLAGASDVVAQLMQAAPRMSLLATSRRPVHVEGEHQHPIEPLGVAGSAAGAGEPGGAVELFVQHARMTRPDFQLTPENSGDVAAVCEQLDGLPLAIVLAASRIKLLTPRALRAQLDRVLEFQAGTAGRPGRQRTLRDTVAWSYELLGTSAQVAFRHLGAFAGSCDLPAFAAVAGGDSDVFDLVAELADGSLVVVRDGPDGEPRVGMLQTVRSFARSCLEEAGEADQARSAHAAHYASVAESTAPSLRERWPLPARDRLEADMDDYRSALGWSLRPHEDPVLIAAGLRLCQALSWFWYAFGYTDEGNEWQRRAVAAASAEGGVSLARALHGLAILRLQQGGAAEARDMLTACLDIWQRAGDRSGMARELSSLGVARWTLGDGAAGRAMLEQSAELAAEIGDERAQSSALSNLAMFDLSDGRPDRAISVLRQVSAIDARLGDAWSSAVNEANLAVALVSAGRADEALALLRERAASIVALGDVELTINVVESLAMILAAQGSALRAAAQLGTADALRDQSGMPRPGPDVEMMDQRLGAARAAVPPRLWDEHWRTGRGRTALEALHAEGVIPAGE